VGGVPILLDASRSLFTIDAARAALRAPPAAGPGPAHRLSAKDLELARVLEDPVQPRRRDFECETAGEHSGRLQCRVGGAGHPSAVLV
jgi:hypothetical protein